MKQVIKNFFRSLGKALARRSLRWPLVFALCALEFHRTGNELRLFDLPLLYFFFETLTLYVVSKFKRKWLGWVVVAIVWAAIYKWRFVIVLSILYGLGIVKE